ncbi:delta serrate ligand domain-containing protein [Ditylenchus destructor]|nr:delta serrate ligand domain-containing protein [Ditylenchus destructor]
MNNGVYGAGFVELHIRQLTLRRIPPGCCRNEIECALSQDFHRNRHSFHLCPLKFQVCLSPVETPAECLILSRNFSTITTMAPNSESSTEMEPPFATTDLPKKEFTFTSAAIAQNISITLEVWSSNGAKLLLFSRHHGQISTANQAPRTFAMSSSDNSLVFQLSAKCARGFVGEGCSSVCQEPGPRDNYACTPQGMKCFPGWDGQRCTQPICEMPCFNGGVCSGPNQCKCPQGWAGQDCATCVPRQGCSSKGGYCTEPGKCLCKPNWTGVNCDVIIDKCLEKPCKNGGKCTTNGFHGDAFYCTCLPAFGGDDCSRISNRRCTQTTCGTHGQCIPIGPLANDIYCQCDPGYYGSDCGLRIGEIPLQPMAAPQASSMPESTTSSSSVQTPQRQIWLVNVLVALCALLLLLILIAVGAPLIMAFRGNEFRPLFCCAGTSRNVVSADNDKPSYVSYTTPIAMMPPQLKVEAEEVEEECSEISQLQPKFVRLPSLRKAESRNSRTGDRSKSPPPPYNELELDTFV